MRAALPMSRRLAVFLFTLGISGVSHGEDAALPAGMALAALPRKVKEPEDNRSTPERVELGRLLFFDPVLSESRDVACATCHHPKYGWADGLTVPIGRGGDGLGPSRHVTERSPVTLLTRNAPSLLNVAFNGWVNGVHPPPQDAPMFWDNRVHGLEAQAAAPIEATDEMAESRDRHAGGLDGVVERLGEIPAYEDRFTEAYEGGLTKENVTRALAVFERSLVTRPSRFDRWMRGKTSALTAEEQHGLEIFRRAGCVQCHGGPMFSDYKLHFIGVPGTGPDARREFRTPTLRQLRHTGPYMHHGSMATLRDVLVFYEALSDAVSETLDGGDAAAQPPLDPLLRHLNLLPADFPALEAFLGALNTEYDRSAPESVPSGLAVPE